MDKVRSKLDTSKNSLRRSRNNAAGSKMKIERLKAMLQNLKDDERLSKVRNQHLLQDFDKVNEFSDDLDTKARKLKRVKQEYEKYITSVYPHWKENVEISRMTKLQSPDEEFKLRKDQHFSEQKDNWSLQRRDKMNVHLSPLYSSSRGVEGDSQLSSTHYGKSTDNNPYLSLSDFNSPRDLMSESFAQGDQSVTVRSKSLNPVYADSYHYGRPALSVNKEKDRGIHLSKLSSFNSSAPVNTDQRSITSQVKPSQLNIPRVGESADISSFTILPQALALSPDGQLVLLPMACSPQINLPRDFRTDTNSYEMKSKMGTLDGSSSDYDNIDVPSKNLENSMASANQDTKTANGKVPENPKEYVSLLKTDDQFASSNMDGNILYDGENKGLGRQFIGKFNVDDEHMVSYTEYEKMEKDEKDINNKSDENHSGNDKIISKQDIGAENSMASQLHQGKNHLLSRSGSNSLEQTEGMNGRINGSKQFSEEHFDDKGNDKDKYSDLTSKPLNEDQNGIIGGKDELVDDVLNSVLDKEERKELFDIENYLQDVHKLENDNEKVAAEVITAANEYTSLEVPKSEFVDNESAENRDREKVNFNEVETTELNKLPVFEVEEDKITADMNNGAITSGGKVDGYDYDIVNGKSTSDDIEVNNEKSEEVNGEKIWKTEKKEWFLDIPEISYLFEEIEDRMEYVDHNEFYRKPVEDTSCDSLTKIKKVLLLEGNLSEFETCDLCLVSRVSVEEFVEKNSKSGFIIREEKDLSTVYTLDGFREILLGKFEELWEYVFNHMELLTANQIFEPSAVCEIFSKMLCPGCPTVAFEVSQTILRIMDGVVDDVKFEDDQEYSLGDEELSPVESDISQNNIEISHDNLSTEKRDKEVTTKGAILTSESPTQELDIGNDAGSKEATIDPNVNKLTKAGSFDKQNPSKERKGNSDDLLLDLGDLSNDDDDDDDDDESTFDSAKLTPHHTTATLGQQNSGANDVNSGREDTISESGSEQMAEDVPKKMEDEKDNDAEDESSDDLEDLLSNSLVLNSNKNKKDFVQYRKPLSIFEQKRDSFDVDESNSMEKMIQPTEKKEIFSPQHSKSISSKFRKPGFWENSDTESEAGDLNISAGNKLSNHSASEDEFDFKFYN